MNRSVVLIRTEGVWGGGFGHLRRCLTLAEALRKSGAEPKFAVRGDPQAEKLIREEGFETVGVGPVDEINLEETVEFAHRWRARGILVDSYRIRNLTPLSGRAKVIGVLDDLADRSLSVNLVINGAVYASSLQYQVPPNTKMLLGPAYVLLREEFSTPVWRTIRNRVERLLITVGGADPTGLTLHLLAWGRRACFRAAFDVVVGPFFSQDVRTRIWDMTHEMANVAIHESPKDIRNLMLACDLAVTGGGQTTYELASTGTPAVVIELAANQRANVEGLAKAGVLASAGMQDDPDLSERVFRLLGELDEGKQRRETMSRAGRTLVDGMGTGRVAQTLLEMCR